MQIRVHGLAAREGETAFAFLVLRLATPVDRDGLIELIGQLALLVPDAASFVTELPDDCEAAMRLVGIPWSPPADAGALEAQHRLIEGAGLHGIEEAWFFQTGTRLPSVAAAEADEVTGDHEVAGGDDDEGAGDDDEGAGDDDEGAGDDDEGAGADDGAGDDEVTGDHAVAGGDDDLEEAWSHGPPPQLAAVPFPVDGYPEILEDLDWEDFGIAVKLAGPWTPGEATVLLGFHAMWLTPYGGRYRNARVTIDPVHHAAHLWVDRFAVPCSPEEQVQHLLWIVSKLDEVMPVVHARFAGATMEQKYGSLTGALGEPFVLGGNPLLAIHASEGEAGVDAWIATQTAWSNEEVAPMLRELAIDLVTQRDPVPARTGAASAADDHDVDAVFEAAGIGVDNDADADEAEADADEAEADADDAEADADEADEDEDEGEDEASDEEDAAEPPRARQLTAYVSELLTTRAYLGKLDPRAADKLRPALATGAKYEHRRTAIVSILGAMRDRDSVPAMIRILETTTIASALDAIGKEDLVTATVRALGMIADPRAIPTLSNQITVPGPHNDEPRLPAALSLSACLAAASNPPEPAPEVFEALLRLLREVTDDELAADLHVAYSALASRLSPDRRERALVGLHTLDDDRVAARSRDDDAHRLDDDDDGQVN